MKDYVLYVCSQYHVCDAHTNVALNKPGKYVAAWTSIINDIPVMNNLLVVGQKNTNTKVPKRTKNYTSTSLFFTKAFSSSSLQLKYKRI